jgi:predicted hydrocarbon binding protein
MANRTDRVMPPRIVSSFFNAIIIELGNYSLNTLFKDAQMRRFLSGTPKTYARFQIRSSEFAELQHAVREYYGTGSRGILTRIGYATWENLEECMGWQRKLTNVMMGENRAIQRNLAYLASQLRGKNGNVSVHQLDPDTFFVDRTSDTTFQQESNTPICWVTIGMLQGAVSSITSQVAEIQEVSCRAMGDDSCRFQIIR